MFKDSLLLFVLCLSQIFFYFLVLGNVRLGNVRSGLISLVWWWGVCRIVCTLLIRGWVDLSSWLLGIWLGNGFDNWFVAEYRSLPVFWFFYDFILEFSKL